MQTQLTNAEIYLNEKQADKAHAVSCVNAAEALVHTLAKRLKAARKEVKFAEAELATTTARLERAHNGLWRALLCQWNFESEEDYTRHAAAVAAEEARVAHANDLVKGKADMTQSDINALSMLAADGMVFIPASDTYSEENHARALNSVSAFLFNILAHEAAHAECCGARYA